MPVWEREKVQEVLRVVAGGIELHRGREFGFAPPVLLCGLQIYNGPNIDIISSMDSDVLVYITIIATPKPS